VAEFRLPRAEGEPARRSLALFGFAILVALGAAVAAEALQALIGLITNLAYFHRWSTAVVSPAGTPLGVVTVFIPIAGGVVVGLIARYGHAAVRGHGIPEAMERVLYVESRISPRPHGAQAALGGGLGALLGRGLVALVPGAGVDARIAGLVGMAAMFAGASRAVLASVIFAFEATRQSLRLLPLLAGCSTGYLISIVGMRNSIMTERLARRGAPVRTEYSVDYLSQQLVRDHAVRDVAVLAADG
jgi:H+/Cl- antiporter ClcA